MRYVSYHLNHPTHIYLLAEIAVWSELEEFQSLVRVLVEGCGGYRVSRGCMPLLSMHEQSTCVLASGEL